MSYNLRHYSPGDIYITFGGLSLSSGLGEDSFVSITPDEDSYTLKVGVDGEATRSKSRNRSHTITFTLMQTSEANRVLSAMHALDLASPGGVVVPLTIVDSVNNQEYFAETAWVQKAPDRTFSKEVGEWEWTVRTNNLIVSDLLPSDPESAAPPTAL